MKMLYSYQQINTEFILFTQKKEILNMQQECERPWIYYLQLDKIFTVNGNQVINIYKGIKHEKRVGEVDLILDTKNADVCSGLSFSLSDDIFFATKEMGDWIKNLISEADPEIIRAIFFGKEIALFFTQSGRLFTLKVFKIKENNFDWKVYPFGIACHEVHGNYFIISKK